MIWAIHREFYQGLEITKFITKARVVKNIQKRTIEQVKISLKRWLQ